MRNKDISERELLDRVRRQIARCLPSAWSVEERSQQWLGPSPRPDLILTVRAPRGESAELVLEARAKVEAKDIPALQERLGQYRAVIPDLVPVIVAPFLSRWTRERLAERELSFADATGNVRVVADEPALFIAAGGAERSPWRVARPLASLRGRGSGRAARAFCDYSPPYRLGELAAASNTPAPTLSRVADLLEREGILTRGGSRGPIAAVDWKALLARWAQDYSLTDANRSGSYLEPRGVPNLLAKIGASTDLRYAVTGSFAAVRVAAVVEPRLVTLFVPGIDDAASRLELRRAETGGNVLLLEPYDPVVFERTAREETITYAGFSQVAVDLLTGPGRAPAEAEALIGWMEEHEASWRQTTSTA